MTIFFLDRFKKNVAHFPIVFSTTWAFEILLDIVVDGIGNILYGKVMNAESKKKSHSFREKQLTMSKEFEEDLFTMAHPWAKSCKKIKRVLEDFFKNS